MVNWLFGELVIWLTGESNLTFTFTINRITRHPDLSLLRPCRGIEGPNN
jgi:hypothetical protein